MAQFFRELYRFFRWRGKPQSSAQAPSGVEYIVFGIGNVGRRYSRTRHNIGFRVVDRCLSHSRELTKDLTAAAGAYVVAGEFSGKKVAFVKPTTFVNQCGAAFQSGATAFGLPLGSCLVVVDDYNLPLGAMRFRAGGSDGGHNGLKSIIEAVGRDFPRLRIGIGPLPPGTNPVDFVLGSFSSEEETVLARVMDRAVDGIASALNNGIEKAMSVYNRPQAEK